MEPAETADVYESAERTSSHRTSRTSFRRPIGRIGGFIDGRFWLVSVAIHNGRKFIHRAWSGKLAGPWTWEDGPLIDTGPAGAFDEKHTDAVSGFYFPDRKEILYFYMGYPRQAAAEGRSARWAVGREAVAAQKSGESKRLRRLGMVLPPAQKAGHWAGGYVGGRRRLV